MPQADTLTPPEAAKIAANCYFALKNWINNEPMAGQETRASIHNRVLGPGNIGTNIEDINPSLQDTDLRTANLGRIHSARTGFGTSSGFGYTLTYQSHHQRHIIIATRGTRPELGGNPDLLTDLRAGFTSFEDFGPVHIGFKKTFDTILPSISPEIGLIRQTDVIHCVGHSLGGAVATLLAAHFASTGKRVRLYTFGSPRVGYNRTYKGFEEIIGIENIFRVAHDLDPITLIAPFPYMHVQPSPSDPNNMTLPSPSGRLLSTDNHDVYKYIQSVVEMTSWQQVRSSSKRVDFDNALIARWLLHESHDPGWVRYASAKTLSILFKLFSHQLKQLSTSAILGLTAVDILAEILIKAIDIGRTLGENIVRLLKYAATWAGIQAQKAADFTVAVIRALLEKILAVLKALAVAAVNKIQNNITPTAICIAGSWTLTAASAF